MKIILCVTGGIAAYKSPGIASVLESKGYEVQVVLTRHAESFIKPVSFAVTRRRVLVDADEWNERTHEIPHIYYPQEWKADAFVVAPATANIIGKFANGIADDIVSSMYLACPETLTKLIFPAMNTFMLHSKAVQRNLETLIKDGCFIGETEKKKLACGIEGDGALADTKYIIENIEHFVLPKSWT